MTVQCEPASESGSEAASRRPGSPACRSARRARSRRDAVTVSAYGGPVAADRAAAGCGQLSRDRGPAPGRHGRLSELSRAYPPGPTKLCKFPATVTARLLTTDSDRKSVHMVRPLTGMSRRTLDENDFFRSNFF